MKKSIPIFFKKIIAGHPKLTNNELRHLAYSRLNLSNKEIAELMGVSLQAVKMARNRLAKKLGFTGSISSFIREFSVSEKNLQGLS